MNDIPFSVFSFRRIGDEEPDVSVDRSDAFLKWHRTSRNVSSCKIGGGLENRSTRVTFPLQDTTLFRAGWYFEYEVSN